MDMDNTPMPASSRTGSVITQPILTTQTPNDTDTENSNKLEQHSDSSFEMINLPTDVVAPINQSFSSSSSSSVSPSSSKNNHHSNSAAREDGSSHRLIHQPSASSTTSSTETRKLPLRSPSQLLHRLSESLRETRLSSFFSSSSPQPSPPTPLSSSLTKSKDLLSSPPADAAFLVPSPHSSSSSQSDANFVSNSSPPSLSNSDVGSERASRRLPKSNPPSAIRGENGDVSCGSSDPCRFSQTNTSKMLNKTADINDHHNGDNNIVNNSSSSTSMPLSPVAPPTVELPPGCDSESSLSDFSEYMNAHVEEGNQKGSTSSSAYERYLESFRKKGSYTEMTFDDRRSQGSGEEGNYRDFISDEDDREFISPISTNSNRGSIGRPSEIFDPESEDREKEDEYLFSSDMGEVIDEEDILHEKKKENEINESGSRGDDGRWSRSRSIESEGEEEKQDSDNCEEYNEKEKDKMKHEEVERELLREKPGRPSSAQSSSLCNFLADDEKEEEDCDFIKSKNETKDNGGVCDNGTSSSDSYSDDAEDEQQEIEEVTEKDTKAVKRRRKRGLQTSIEETEMLKADGNKLFAKGMYQEAIGVYSQALIRCPDDNDNIAAVLLANRAACNLSLNRYEEVISDCTDAIELDDRYVKAYLRRFRAHEALAKWHDALSDINKAIELDPSLISTYGRVQKKTEQMSQEQFEKEKEEMMGKLKEFGNWALGKVGLSLDNFKVEQNSETGAYNIQFNQGGGGK